MAVAQHQRIGPYEVLGSLARGGMAELFVARRAGIDGFAKHVVIKRVLPELARDRAFVELFLAEARTAATLDHQNIVHVHDIGQDADGYFLAMELLHGADVGSLLGVATRFGGALPPALAIEIARGACAGLHHVHERTTAAGAPLGLVHRDVSPSNLFVTFDGAVKLLDFGIAKAARSTGSQTRTGELRGKVPYMSPEQCCGEPLDRRSDVFSLSIVLWEMTVGARLYGGDGEPELATMRAIVERDARRPSDTKAGYPAALEQIVMRGLARDRAARYQTADELQGELEAFARTAGMWSSAREIARFMADVFPDRANAWREHERRGTVPLLVPGRQTTPLLVAPGTAESEPAAGAPSATASPPGASASPGSASPPAMPGSPTGAGAAGGPGRARPAPILVAIAAVTSLGAALVLGVAWGRATSSPDDRAGAPTSPGGEDAMWFQPDDYLISRDPFHGERLDMLWVAKPLSPPVSPGAAAPFIDVNGEELTTEHHWRTRIATPGDLAIGARAFCRVESNQRGAKAPRDRDESRGRTWMLGRVTDVSRLSAREVSIANATCDLRAVRVSLDP